MAQKSHNKFKFHSFSNRETLQSPKCCHECWTSDFNRCFKKIAKLETKDGVFRVSIYSNQVWTCFRDVWSLLQDTNILSFTERTVPVKPTTNVHPSTILKTTRFPWHPNVSAEGVGTSRAAFAKLTNLEEANRRNESNIGVKERSETSTSSSWRRGL